MKYIWLSCSHFYPKAIDGNFITGCCTSCINDEEANIDSMREEEPDKKNYKQILKFQPVARCCCTHSKKFTRKEWADALKLYRKWNK